MDGRRQLDTLSPDQKRQLLADLLRARDREPRERPLSPGQRRFWFLEQLNPGTTELSLPMALTLRGPLDVALLERAMTELVRRHETLRTRIVRGEADAVQVIEPAEPIVLPVVDLTGVRSGDREADADRRAAEQAARPFDFARGPLWRATLLRLAPDSHRLCLVLHHMMADGLSMGLFVRDLTTIYAALAAGREPDLPPITLQYGDFAAQQVADMVAGRFKADLDYWRQVLDGAPATLDLPTRHGSLERRTLRGESVEVSLPAELTAAIRAVSRGRGVTPFVTMISAFAVLLGRLAGVDDLVLGAPVAGRSAATLAPIVGLFMNTLPIRFDLGRTSTFAALLSRSRQRTVEAQSHQAVPFDAIVTAVKPERRSSRTPIFQVLFNMIDVPDQRHGQMGDVTVETQGGFDASTRFDLTLYVMPDGDGLRLTALFAADLFTAEEMRTLLGRYQRMLAEAIASPDLPLSALGADVAPADAVTLASLSPSAPPGESGPGGTVSEAGGTLEGFLDRLRRLDVRVWIDGERLRCSAPAGVLTAELKQEIGERKPALIALLSSGNTGDLRIPPVPRTAATYPASFTQERMWFLQQLAPDSPAYIVGGGLKVVGDLRIEVLKECWATLADRHELLHSRLTVVEGGLAIGLDGARPEFRLYRPARLPA